MTSEKSRYAVFFLLLISLGSAIVVLNVKFPSIVGGLYTQSETGFLKKITLTEEKATRPLDYYVGKTEDIWVGPLTSLVSGGLFLLFCMWFLQRASALKFGAAAFLYLLATKFQVLFYPPFGDGLFGVLSEPLWLIRHHLDWMGLIGQAPYGLGGPLMYPESIYPKFIAMLMYVSPSPRFFLFMNHGIVFLAGAVVVATLRAILLEFFDQKRAMLGAILFLALPIFQCHVELLNMEPVCSCFAVMCLLMALRRDFFWASTMAVFAMMAKVPGAITTIVIFGACLFSLSNGSGKKKFWVNILWVLGACAVALCLSAIRQTSMGEQPVEFRLGFLTGWRMMKPLAIFWLFLFLSGVYLGRSVFWWISRKSNERRLAAFLNEHYKSLVVFLAAASWFLLYINSPAIVPRYTVLAIPFVLLFFVYLFASFVKRENVCNALMIAMILFALLCSHGLLYIHEKADGGTLSERSLEYRNVLRVYVRAAKEIEKNYSDFALGAPILMAQILTSKEAGYISKPLRDVFVYGSGATHEGIHPYPGLQNINILKTIWIAQTDGDPDYLSIYPIGSKDKILKEIWAGDKRITLFMGGYSIEALARAVAKRYMGDFAALPLYGK